MKKSLAIILILFVLSAGFAGYAHGFVNAESDNVIISEKTLLGDIKNTEGIVISENVICNQKMYWETEYDIFNNKPQTKFTFYNKGKQAEYAPDPYSAYRLNMYVATNFGMAMSGGSIDFDSHDELFGFGKMVYEIYQNTPKTKGEYSATVYIKDYYDYYPITVDNYGAYYEFEYRGEIVKDYNYTPENSKSISVALNDYFKIAVNPDHAVEINIEIDDAGYLVGLNINPTEEGKSFYLDASSFGVEDGCLIAFNNNAAGSGIEVDMSAMEDGYGIYLMPVEETENGKLRALTEHIEVVYPVDINHSIHRMELSEDRSKIYLITVEEGYYYLSVINAKDYSTLQKLKLFEYDEANTLSDTYFYDDYIVLFKMWDEFFVYGENNEGMYEFDFEGVLDAAYPEGKYKYSVFDSYNLRCAYDGQRVAFVDQGYDAYGYDVPTFRVAVYDESGLLYYGEFSSSLNVFSDDIKFDMRTRHYHYAPINIKFK